MPQAVVHELEAIQVQKQDRHQRAGSARTAQRLVEQFHKLTTVRQAGEKIVVGQFSQAGLRLLALRDVPDNGAVKDLF